MIEVLDQIDEVKKYDSKASARKLSAVDLMVVHRIETELTGSPINGAADLAKWFSENPGEGTGGQMPYAFVIRPDGVVEQALRLEDIGPHACKYNATSFGCALLGDFRTEDPTDAQYDALITFGQAWVAHKWAEEIGIGRRAPLVAELIKGHDELPGGSKDANKKCPGRRLPMDKVRRDIQRALEEDFFMMGVVI